MEVLILIFAIGFLCWYLIRHPLKSLKGIGLVALWFVLGTIIVGLTWVMLI
jgi:hypothetical protein